jgi:subtilisin family serine protease
LSAAGTQSLDRHLVVLGQQAPPSSDFLAALAAAGGRVERRQDSIGTITVSGLSDAAVAALGARSDVEAIGRDRIVQWLPPVEPSAPVEPLGVVTESDQSGTFWFVQGWQWNIGQINANDAWLVSPQGSGALVCILDTGIDSGHVDLRGKVDATKSASFVAAEPTIDDYHFHGTFIAGLVASDGVSMASVAPDARLCAVKVLNQSGQGSFDDVIAGTMHAASIGADVINMSFGVTVSRNDPDMRAVVHAMQRAVLFAVSKGALVVAAAGNTGLNLDKSDLIVVPAELAGVLSVGATAPLGQTNFDRLASYTNFGMRSVDLMAPGGDTARVVGHSRNLRDGLVSVCSRSSLLFPVCALGNFYLQGGFGTSFAAPHVAGAAAVLESAMPGNQIGAQLESCLIKGAVHPDGKLLSPLYGRGRIDVLRSVQASGCAQVATQ